ncbi:O-acetylserine/cysteine efflux transporter [Microbacterium endophyticum]|uniref:O-acetylserine/cysteine efflux transporter n=1 Tax=Microbacterium endophyticum TaxID=1526412 RepID=A0A7W4YN37_9MICO|nr:EamA family transporter [Microbacterium endophyticum]MBB2975742.1 O-acetylserine/cysteine efflux transporter [Microbacterium endophyticum]NIK36225.1 O-acetylserine/cysteine efflux transporter [Microbacterium endophyticum]
MPLRATLAAFLVALIWGMNFVVIDAGLEGMPPLLFLAIRFVVVIIPAIFFVPKPAARWRDIAAIGFFLSLAQFSMLYISLALGMPPGLASLVVQGQVVLTVVFAAMVLHEVPTRVQLIGISVGALGLLIIGLGRGGDVALLAFMCSVGAATAWAIGNVLTRRVGRSAPGGTPAPLAGLSMTVWSALVVPIPAFAISLLFDGPSAVGYALTHLTVPQLLSTAYTAWLASLVGYGIWNTLLGKYQASAVVPFTMLVPVVGIFAAWLVQDEVPTVAELIGGGALLVGVAITTGLLAQIKRWRMPQARRLR